jgi:hypothetical protein
VQCLPSHPLEEKQLDLLKQIREEHDELKVGPRLLWLLVSCCGGADGCIVSFGFRSNPWTTTSRQWPRPSAVRLAFFLVLRAASLIL